jgi:hypothetical protein
MTEGYWRQKELKDVDPTSQVNFLPLTKMYMGSNIAILLMKPEYLQRAVDVQYFLQKVQEFYIEAALQIKKKFPIGNPMIELLEVLDPNVNCSKFPSLVPLAVLFPNIIPESDLQKLDNEWRKLAIGIPFDKEGMEPEEFWGKLSEVTDGTSSPQFNTLCNFMGSLLSLPHANVDVERIFSSVNLIKTRIRNKLHTKTVRALLKSKDGVKSSGGCVEFTPSAELKKRMRADVLYNSDSSGSDSDC